MKDDASRIADLADEADEADVARETARLIDEVARLRVARRRRRPPISTRIVTATEAAPQGDSTCQPSEKEPASSNNGSSGEESGESSPFSQMADELLENLEQKPTRIVSPRSLKRA